jgi:hypothetical protein
VTAPAGIGTFNYTIFCNKTSHESKNATDIFNTTTTPSFSTYIVISDFTNIIENSTVKLWAYYENLSNNATITGANCTLSGFWNGSMTYNSSAGRYEKIVTAPALSGNETSENYTIACVKIELEGNYQLSQATDSFLLQYQPSATQFFVETATELGQGMGNMMNSVFTAVIYFVVSLAFAGAIITILII